MIKNGFRENIFVKYSEMNFDKSLKPCALLNYLQDLASDNAEKLGFGYSYINPKNLMWFLLKYRIEFEEYPIGVNELTLLTEPRGFNKLFAYRDFELYSGKTFLGKAASAWALFDMEHKSLLSIEKVINNNPYMQKYIQRDDDLQFSKIQLPQETELQKEFEVRYNDIDVNLHANNSNYIIWAMEPLSFDFKTKHKLKSLEIVFKKEIKYRETLISKVQIVDNTKTLHLLKNNNTREDLCYINCEWEIKD